MALNEDRLTNKIQALLEHEAEQEENPEDSRERFARGLARAIIEEITEVGILYTGGLQAATYPVIGQLEYQIQ